MNLGIAGYVRLGRITRPIAQEIGYPAGYIYADKSNQHLKKHKQEINSDPINFITYVVKNHNQIRQGSEGSILLVVFSEKLSKVTALKIHLLQKKNIYVVKTALVMTQSKIKNKKILWEK